MACIGKGLTENGLSGRDLLLLIDLCMLELTERIKTAFRTASGLFEFCFLTNRLANS